jgi:hypothetical protein
MKVVIVFVIAIVALVALTGAANAAGGGRPFRLELSGAAENPPADPDGSGAATIRLNPGRERICFSITVEDIAPATAAHIHEAPVGSNGPVVVGLAPPTDGSSSGCVDAERDLIFEIMADPEEYYVNVHNAEYPGGAVRGQLD